MASRYPPNARPFQEVENDSEVQLHVEAHYIVGEDDDDYTDQDDQDSLHLSTISPPGNASMPSEEAAISWSSHDFPLRVSSMSSQEGAFNRSSHSLPLPMISPLRDASMTSQEGAICRSSANAIEENEDSQRRMGGGEASSSDGKFDGGEWNRSEMDGLYCPICMEAWTSGGDHQICCLPCGHLYGLACIKRWFQDYKNSRECPQCNKKCLLKDIRVLYVPEIAVIDQELQKKIRSLEAKCASLEKKDADWCEKEIEWRRREADLHQQVQQLMGRGNHLKSSLGDTQSWSPGSLTASGVCQEQSIFGHKLAPEFSRKGSSNGFVLQKELQVDGARLFDVDASSQILIIAQRLSGMGGMHVLTKMSLIAPHERENIQLPVNTRAVKDLHVSPHGKLTLFASLGKKISLLSTDSNNIILNYDLPSAAWSCSWDLNNMHYIYAGLQNGMLLVFDMRQTMTPVESVIGLTSYPIHTMHSLSPDLTLPSGVRTLLTASSAGLCQWNFGGIEERPYLIPESENQGVCISLAYCPSSDDIVASFRPKVGCTGGMVFSQPSLTPSTSLPGQGVHGSHVLYKRVGSKNYQKLGSKSANLPDVRLPRSAIIDAENDNPLFASGDEVTCELVLQELPSFLAVQHLKSLQHPLRDVKYARALSSGILGCLNGDTLQLFSVSMNRKEEAI